MQETRVDSRAEPQHEVAEKGPYRYRVPGARVKPIRLASGPTEAQESWGIPQGWEPAQEVTEVQLPESSIKFLPTAPTAVTPGNFTFGRYTIVFGEPSTLPYMSSC